MKTTTGNEASNRAGFERVTSGNDAELEPVAREEQVLVRIAGVRPRRDRQTANAKSTTELLHVESKTGNLPLSHTPLKQA